MINSLRKNVFLFIVLNLFIIQQGYAQDENNLWVIGIGVNAIDFYPSQKVVTDNDDGKSNINFGGPQILATRYLVNHLSVDGLLTFNQITKYGVYELIEKYTYVAMDINFRYSFIDTTKDFTLFALAGVGYTSFNPETIWIGGTPIKFGSGGTLNIGGGANYWFSDTLGLNFEALYKSSVSEKLSSHFYAGLSLVFRLKSKGNDRWRDCF